MCRYAQKFHGERLRNNQNISKYTWLKNNKSLFLSSSMCSVVSDFLQSSPPDSSVYGISRQQYWSGLPFPTPGNLPDPGIKPMSLCLHIGRWVPYVWATWEALLLA